MCERSRGNSFDSSIDELCNLNHSVLLKPITGNTTEPKQPNSHSCGIKVNTSNHSHGVNNSLEYIRTSNSKALWSQEEHWALPQQVLGVLVHEEWHQVLPDFFTGRLLTGVKRVVGVLFPVVGEYWLFLWWVLLIRLFFLRFQIGGEAARLEERGLGF